MSEAPTPGVAVEQPSAGLYGQWRDVLYDADGAVIEDRGWRRNTIVADCRRLLAGFMRGAPTTQGVFGLAVGAGLPSWDSSGPPQPQPSQVSLVDPNPYVLLAGPDFQLEFINPANGTISGDPTSTLQLKATFGPGVPTWPDGNHATSTLREFGLVARLDGDQILINYRTHPAIAKDAASTLERTVWLVF